jgi:hypothetical protein
MGINSNNFVVRFRLVVSFKWINNKRINLILIVIVMLILILDHRLFKLCRTKTIKHKNINNLQSNTYIRVIFNNNQH